ncbi:MAG: hypothetical protein AB7L84_09780, partial [Acidimicrobiia bacterium]
MSAFLRKYATGSGADLYVPIIKRDSIDFAVAADWTPAAGDVKVSKDGGAAANIGTLPTAVTMGNTAMWKFVLSDAELTCKTLAIFVADAATKAVEDQAVVVETYGHASALHPFDLASATVTLADGGLTAAKIATDAITAAKIATDAIGAAELAADAVTEIQAGLATAAALAVVDAYLDTEVAAIKAKTDNLPATPASQGDVAAVAAYVDTEVAAILAAVDTEVAAIKAKTDNLPAAPAATGDIPSAATVAAAVAALVSAVQGTAQGGTTTTVQLAAGADASDDAYNGR